MRMKNNGARIALRPTNGGGGGVVLLAYVPDEPGLDHFTYRAAGPTPNGVQHKCRVAIDF